MQKKSKILFVCTQDWFFKSHFMPLAQAAVSQNQFEVVLVTNISKHRKEIEQTKVRLIDFDLKRSSKNVFSAFLLLWNLILVLRKERPDIIHFLALKPILLGGLAAFFVPKSAAIYHLTGLGYLAESKSRIVALIRNISFWLITMFLRRKKSWLIIENPDDLAFVKKHGKVDESRISEFGGAGVDPNYYVQFEDAKNKPKRVAYVGRMIWTKGVDVLINAMGELEKRNIELILDMYGEPDYDNPRAIQLSDLQEWNERPNINWHGATTDVRQVWKQANFSVIATRTREGMPRAMLEAASCGRALIVTNIAGCRHFVRNGIEGIIVPPDDYMALADALEELTENSKKREKMGKAARQRVVDAYSENHIREEVVKIYKALSE